MYARRAPGHRLRLKTFAVSETGGTHRATLGQHITMTANPVVHLELTGGNTALGNLKIMVIREGKVIRTLSSGGDTAITFEDPVVGGSGTTYYRCIVLQDGWPVLASNPVFVTIRPGPGAPFVSKQESGA